MIYHIVTPSHWKKFDGKDYYFSETFEQEKFIHCSTIEQLAGVLQRYYKNEGTVLRLEIDEEKLTVEPVYEVATNGDEFPHIYGGIDKDAIISVTELSEGLPGEYTINE